jgi:hypothetical protein
MTIGLISTSLSSPRSQASSETFKQYGVTGEIAAPIRECRITAASTPTSITSLFLPQIIVAAIQASFLKTDLVLGGPTFHSILNVARGLREIFTYPDNMFFWSRRSQ